MFSALRQGSLFYILDKSDSPTLKVGHVVGVSQPMPKYGNQYQIGQAEMVVDVSVKVGEDVIKFEKLPSSLCIANFGQNGIVVSESREAMNGEVESMLRTSRGIIESVPYHEKVIQSCDGIMRGLNPQFAKEKEHEEKIGKLELKMDGMDKTLANISMMLNQMLNKPKKEEQS